MFDDALELFLNGPARDVIASAARQSILKIGPGWIASSTRNDDNKGLERTLLFRDTTMKSECRVGGMNILRLFFRKQRHPFINIFFRIHFRKR